MVPVKCPALLGTPDIKLLDILTINYKMVDTESPTEWNIREQTEGWCYTNKTKDAKAQGQCFANPDSNSYNETNTVIANKSNSNINCF